MSSPTSGVPVHSNVPPAPKEPPPPVKKTGTYLSKQVETGSSEKLASQTEQIGEIKQKHLSIPNQTHTTKTEKTKKTRNIKQGENSVKPSLADKFHKMVLTKILGVPEKDASNYIAAKNELDSLKKEFKAAQKSFHSLFKAKNQTFDAKIEDLKTQMERTKEDLGKKQTKITAILSELPGNTQALGTLKRENKFFENEIGSLEQQIGLIEEMEIMNSSVSSALQKPDTSDYTAYTESMETLTKFISKLKNHASVDPKISQNTKSPIESKEPFTLKDAIQLTQKYYPHLTPFLHESFRQPMSLYSQQVKKATRISHAYESFAKQLESNRNSWVTTSNKAFAKNSGTKSLYDLKKKLENEIDIKLNAIAKLEVPPPQIIHSLETHGEIMPPKLKISPKVISNAKQIQLVKIEASIHNRLNQMEQMFDVNSEGDHKISREQLKWLETTRNEVFMLALQAKDLEKIDDLSLKETLEIAFPYKPIKENTGNDNQRDIYTRLKPIQRALSIPYDPNDAFLEFLLIDKTTIRGAGIEINPSEFPKPTSEPATVKKTPTKKDLSSLPRFEPPSPFEDE